LTKKRVDLHIHTNASDGTWGVKELIDEVLKKDIRFFSITDHDDISNVKEILNYELDDKLNFVKGVEISSSLDGIEFHITAYNYDIDNKKLNDLLKLNRKTRDDFNKKIIRYFEKVYNLKLLNQYNEYKHEHKRGGWKSLNFLIDNRLVTDLNDFFVKVSNMEEEMTFFHPKKIIEIVHKANGFAFLAHPASYFKERALSKEYIRQFADMGIDGLEAYSPYLDALEDAEYYIDFCQNNNLMFSAGSDCHGDFIEERKVGKPSVFLEDINIDKIKD
jgi:predicted metal-dependent phosphoesterase TrpH